jgi:pimeloyl-ACP methyl ester carboxylesterase
MSGRIQHGTGVVEASGTLLYYEIAGAGPPLVLIHEGLADSRMYDDQFDTLAAHHRVVRYDLHGFGRSGTPVQAYSHHAALRDLLDHLGIERAAILGMSQGGAVGIDFTLAYPTMVSALLLLASGINGVPPGEATVRLAAPIREAFQAGDFARAIDLSVRFWVDGPSRGPDEVAPVVRERLRDLYTDVLRRSRERGRAADVLDPPAATRLGEIHVPTLVMVGSGDVPAVLEGADLLARSIPGARKVALPRVAHLLNLECPEEVNRLILEFLHHPASRPS